jgi:hypothetical protein
VFVRFTDDSEDDYGDEYIHETSPIGTVYIPCHGIVIGDNAGIRYERRPWIEHFEFDDIRPAEVCCIWSPEPISLDNQ